MACRKFVYFHSVMAKKGPAYQNCNERQTNCSSIRAQPRKGCPNCEFTIQYKQLLKTELPKELKTLPRGTRKGNRRWPADSLVTTVSEIASIAASTEGVNPKWTVPVAMMVSIYRNEVAKRKSINHAASMPSTSNSGSRDVPDIDEGVE